jgi:hypothetical protein
MLSIPHCIDNWLIGGDKVVSPTVTILDFSILLSFIEREREESWGGGGSERHYRFGGEYNRNIIWQFGRFPGSAR